MVQVRVNKLMSLTSGSDSVWSGARGESGILKLLNRPLLPQLLWPPSQKLITILLGHFCAPAFCRAHLGSAAERDAQLRVAGDENRRADVPDWQASTALCGLSLVQAWLRGAMIAESA
jgi:hypothetical protein